MIRSNIVRLLAALLLTDFLALQLYALHAVGGQALLDMVAHSGPWMWATLADLLIALAVVSGFIWRDARQRGANPLGYVLLTMCTGSVGPLIYLIRQPGDAPRPS